MTVTCMFQGQCRHGPLTVSWKGAWPGSCDPL